MSDECEHGHLARKCDLCCRDREIARLRGLLVKACAEIAEDYICLRDHAADEYPCRCRTLHVCEMYGIRLRWNSGTFEEDTGK